MKTNTIPAQSHLLTKPSFFGNFGRVSLATAAVSLVAFAAAPAAMAAAPNGDYNFVSASGSAKFGGKTLDLPKKAIRKIASVTDGEIQIDNNKIKLNSSSTKKIVEEFADEIDASVKVSITGPTSLQFTKSGSNYVAKTKKPVVASFDGSFHGKDFDGKLKTSYSGTVKGKTLTLVITFSGDAVGSDFGGKITIVAKK